MASLHPNNPRRRSCSTSNTSAFARHSSKRSYSMSIDEIQGRECDPHSVVSRRFPSSSADFNLFPKSRRHTDCSSPRLNHKELTHLRSKAFWELRRSVAENGEGFIRRMRDYERVRSRRISDPSNRSRKRVRTSNTPRKSSFMLDSDVSDDDDVQIFAGELSNDGSQSHHSGNWVPRFGSPSPNLWPTGDGLDGSGYILPILPPPSLTPHRADQGRSVPLNSNPATSPSALPPPPTISSALPPTLLQHPDVNHCSISTLTSSLLPSLSFGKTHCISPEKTVSDLSLALANGGGSINDYGYPVNLPTFQIADGGDPGELWQ